MNPITSHPGHDEQCKCQYVHSAIQKSYRITTEGKHITWKKLEQELDESQKTNIKGKTLNACYSRIYRRWGKEKLKRSFSCTPYSWPEVEAKEFYEWLNLTDNEQNKLLRRIRRVASSHLSTSAAATPTPTPTLPGPTENGLNVLVRAAGVSTSSSTTTAQERRSGTVKARFNEDFTRNIFPILKAILNIKTEINSENDMRKLNQKMNSLSHLGNDLTTSRPKRIQCIEQLLQIVNALFSEVDQRFIHIKVVKNILLNLDLIFITKFANLHANLPESLKDDFFKQFNRYANCCIAFSGSSNINVFFRLEHLLRDKYPATALKLRGLIAARGMTVAPPRQYPSLRPTITPIRRPAPGPQPTTTPSSTPPSTPAPARTTTPSSTTVMSNQEKAHLSSLTNYVRSLINDEEASLDEKKLALESLEILGKRLIRNNRNKHPEKERFVHSKIDALIGSLYWKISQQKKAPKVDLNKPYVHTRKRPAESRVISRRPQKQKTAPLIDLTNDDV